VLPEQTSQRKKFACCAVRCTELSDSLVVAALLYAALLKVKSQLWFDKGILFSFVLKTCSWGRPVSRYT
jgi:hypothetical protein